MTYYTSGLTEVRMVLDSIKAYEISCDDPKTAWISITAYDGTESIFEFSSIGRILSFTCGKGEEETHRNLTIYCKDMETELFSGFIDLKSDEIELYDRLKELQGFKKPQVVVSNGLGKPDNDPGPPSQPLTFRERKPSEILSSGHQKVSSGPTSGTSGSSSSGTSSSDDSDDEGYNY